MSLIRQQIFRSFLNGFACTAGAVSAAAISFLVGKFVYHKFARKVEPNPDILLDQDVAEFQGLTKESESDSELFHGFSTPAVMPSDY